VISTFSLRSALRAIGRLQHSRWTSQISSRAFLGQMPSSGSLLSRVGASIRGQRSCKRRHANAPSAAPPLAPITAANITSYSRDLSCFGLTFPPASIASEDSARRLRNRHLRHSLKTSDRRCSSQLIAAQTLELRTNMISQRLGCLVLCLGVGVAACKPKLPDGVYACDVDTDCPSEFACRESLCRRGDRGGPLGSDASTSDSSDAASAPNQIGERDASAAHDGGRKGRDSGAQRGDKPDAGSGVHVPPPDPPPFMPHTFVPLPSGRSLTAGGTFMRSGQYGLWTSLGQSPATGYPLRTSENYRMVGGIVGVLQPGQ
jgi:hypothetical protein